MPRSEQAVPSDAGVDAYRALVLAPFGRERVLALRSSTRRRLFRATLSVHPLPTHPGGAAAPSARTPGVGAAITSWTAPVAGTGAWDWHLRRELAARLLERAVHQLEGLGKDAASQVLLTWTRSGPAECEDDDAAWWAAARSAGSDLGTQPRCLVVVTRWGWWTLPEGPSRRWQRLRDHRCANRQQGSAGDAQE